jgi:excisionase family DNA binding protein
LTELRRWGRPKWLAGFASSRSGEDVAPLKTTDSTAASALLDEGPLLRPEDAARLLAVKPSWVYEAVRARRLPCIRVGRHLRFTRTMLGRWVAEHVER